MNKIGAALQLSQLLVPVLKGIADYKKTRDQMLAAGEVTYADGSVLSNKELINLFKGDAQSLSDNAEDLIKKYS